ncbi:MAG: C25 family cysteine peptidase, partial [bacterium]
VPGTVVLVPWISANYSGYDLQEKIRNFIIDAHATWGTMYVLLGGQGDYNSSGQNIIPTRMANYIGNEPCDLYYAGLDGTWDANNNHTYGEIADSADMYSDVYVGRAPVYNVAMAQNFVAKTLKYEQDPPTGFIKRMLLPTAILWSSYEERPMVESIARMTGPDWQVGRLYERTGTLSRQAVNDSLHDGWGMSHWDGHGSETGIYMGSSPFFNSADAQALNNGDRTGIAVAIACDCAAWDRVPGGDCVAEHMVNRVGGGFIATVMNTRYGYGAIGPGGNYVPGPSERLDTTFYAGVFQHGMPQIGQALGYAKATWAPYADSLYQYAKQRWCIYCLNLIGDPEIALWTEEPTALNVVHAGVVNIGSSIPYPVTVNAPGKGPVEGALVVLTKPGEVEVKGRTNAGGQVTLYVSALTPGPMAMAVVARNHYVHTDTVMVIASERYVSYLRSVILDPAPGGNNDSILNPGETVNIPTWVKNWGQQPALSVTAKLRTRDPEAQVTDSVRTFGDIPAGDSAWTGASGFGLRVNAGLANAYPVACSLICRDVDDSTWVSNIVFYVGTPVLARTDQAVHDTAHGGNANGRLDPGETVDLAVAIRNTGLGHGYNVVGVLRSADARLHVLDSLAGFGTVRKGDSTGSGTDYFVVRADNGIPPETPMPCTLELRADGPYSVAVPLTILVGEFRTIDPIPDGPRQPAVYYAYDDVDVLYEPHPTYEWVEVSGVGSRISYSQNDAVVLVNLPSGFGPFKFYGQRYTQVSVSADGWVAAGNYTTGNYNNTGLPSSSAPPGVIALNWDDLYPVSGGGGAGYVYHHHDAANRRFIIEYDSVRYYSGTARDKFQVIIYDTTVTSHTGDNVIVAQYMTANGYSSSTVGIQDPGRTVGIQGLFDGSYHRGCAPIAPGRAICYTTDPPEQTGVSEDPAARLLTGERAVAAWPNPARGRAIVAWQLPVAGRVTVRMYDAAGREVRELVAGELAAGRHERPWDCRDNDGRRVAPGVYFVQLEVAGTAYRQKLILAR